MQNNNGQRQKGREARPKTLDLGPKQRDIVERLKSDQGYLASLEEEMRLVKERIAANKGKLDLIAELAQEYGAPQPLEDDRPAEVAETA